MIRWLALALVTAAAATAVVGCGVSVTSNHDQRSDGGPDAGIIDSGVSTAQAFVVAYRGNSCTAAFQCAGAYPGTHTAFDEHYGSSLTDCNSIVTTLASTVQGEVDVGHIVFSPADATSCIRTLVDGDCETFWDNSGPTGAGCSEALIGTETKGEKCVTEYDCITPLVCDANATCS